MKITTLNPTSHLKAFYDFARLLPEQQSSLLKEKGRLLDFDAEKDLITYLYFLKGFFVEEIVCKKSNTVLFILPYKQGFKLDTYLGGKNLLLQ